MIIIIKTGFPSLFGRHGAKLISCNIFYSHDYGVVFFPLSCESLEHELYLWTLLCIILYAVHSLEFKHPINIFLIPCRHLIHSITDTVLQVNIIQNLVVVVFDWIKFEFVTSGSTQISTKKILRRSASAHLFL